ncbi:MAG: hypothetical protein M1503_03795 [Thaumarchaeota archaeon]|nr:hypothetical protein [Nitrososphaerota archaeon]MCL5317376.1 hypothetical protein [Nitrososphaerota archaeon]
MMKRYGWYVPVMVVVLLGVALAVYYIPENGATTSSADEVPRRFGDFQLTGTITGQDALNSVEKMHIGSPGAMKRAVIATYNDASGRKVQLWVADFQDNEVATITLLQMVDAIKKYPEMGFSAPEKHPLNGIDVYVSDGAGGVNTFWAEKNRVVYLLISQVSHDDAFTATQAFMEQYQQII